MYLFFAGGDLDAPTFWFVIVVWIFAVLAIGAVIVAAAVGVFYLFMTLFAKVTGLRKANEEERERPR